MRRRPVTQLRTIEWTAQLWEVSPRTVRRAIESGALRVHRFGRLVRISDADLQAFLDETRSD
jgi:excisionase family DNA binding protein